MECRDYLFNLLESTDDVRTYLKNYKPEFSLLKIQSSVEEEAKSSNPEQQVSSHSKLDDSSLVIHQNEESSLDESSLLAEKLGELKLDKHLSWFVFT